MDDLNAPLGMDRDKGTSRKRGLLPRIFGSLAFVLVGAAAGWALFSNFYNEDKPVLIAKTEAEGQLKPILPAGQLRNTVERAEKTLTESDPDKPGRLDNLTPDGSLEQPRITIINPTQSGPVKLSYLPDRALVENSPFGRLPRISKSGTKPMDAYARPVLGRGTARIAIVVGGLGLSQSGSKLAIERLPGEITLAFAPYGNSLQRWMKMARLDGHELLMQVPMEPVGYPEINPGKNTLISDAPPEKNIANLHWSMARLTNYVGIMNYLGAKLQSDEEAMRPILDEISNRGLFYLDDGSAFAGKSSAIAKQIKLPYLRSDLVIDGGRSAAEIDKNLLLLEKQARRAGKAIGVASAFPLTVRRIARWVKNAEKRGIEIVPISALVN